MDNQSQLTPLLEDEIRGLDSETRALKSSCNVVNPISTLPPEVLSNIFVLRRRGAGQHDRGQNTWLYVTHVSQHWRLAALNCPELWSEVNCSGNPTLGEVMLQRSKDAPLSIKLIVTPCTSDSHLKLFEKCLGQSHRLASVILDCMHSASSEAPSHVMGRITILDIPIIDIAIPPNAQEGIPKAGSLGGRVRSLSLSGPMRSSKLPSNQLLTTLVIHNTSTSLLRCDAKDFIISLESMPHLEHLYLRQFLPTNLYELARGRKVDLPSLHTLELEDAVAPVTNFFSWRKIVAAAQVKVTFTGLGPTSAAPITRCVRALSKSWKEPTTPINPSTAGGATKLTLEDWDEGLTSPQFHCCFGTHGGRGKNRAIRIAFVRSDNATPMDPADLLHALTEQFTISHLRELTLRRCTT